MTNRLKLFLMVAVVVFSMATLAQSAPEPPSPDAAPVVAPVPEAPATPAVPAAKSGAVAPAAAARPEAPRPPAPPRYFRLDLVVKELEQTKVTNSRAYSLVVLANQDRETRSSSVRSGNRVPVATGTYEFQGQTGKNNAPMVNTQFQYIDVGVNIDVYRVREIEGRLSLGISAEISSTGPKTEINQSIIRQNRWESLISVPIGKTVTVFSSDDIASTRTLQLELTATPIFPK